MNKLIGMSSSKFYILFHYIIRSDQKVSVRGRCDSVYNNNRVKGEDI